MSCTIINGVNTLTAGLAGQNVSAVRAMLAQPLNIDPAAKPLINGVDASDDSVLVDGDELEFVKPSGTKGCAA